MKLFLLSIVALVLGSVSPVFAGDIGIMDKDELKSMIGSEELVVLDVRAGRDWSSSEFKIKGAQRADPGDVDSWAGNYSKDKTIVLYCA